MRMNEVGQLVTWWQAGARVVVVVGTGVASMQTGRQDGWQGCNGREAEIRQWLEPMVII